MTSKKTNGNQPGRGGPNGHHDSNNFQFGCSAEELTELTGLCREEVLYRIQECYGDVKEVCRRLHTSPVQGMCGSTTDLQIRRRVFGSHGTQALQKSREVVPFLWNAIWDVTLVVLIAAALISFGLLWLPNETSSDNDAGAKSSSSEWIAYIPLFGLILVVLLAFSVLEWCRRRWTILVSRGRVRKCCVVRGGETIEIPSDELVVGDICLIKYGDIVPAFGLLVFGKNIKVKEKLLDGTIQVVAKERTVDPLLQPGSYVVDGCGRIVIIKVEPTAAPSSNLFVVFDKNNGKIDTITKGNLNCDVSRMNSALLDEEFCNIQFNYRRRSILEAKIKWLTTRLCCAGIVGVLLIAVVLVLRLSLATFATGKRFSVMDYAQGLAKCLLVASAILVIVVPLRLPAGMILSFAQTLRRMIREGNVVHDVGAFESAAYVTDLLINKTGTLSKNDVSAVAQVFFAGRLYRDVHELDHLSAEMRLLLLRLMSPDAECAGNAIMPHSTKRFDSRRHLGNLVDHALLKFVHDLSDVDHDQTYVPVNEAIPEERLVAVYPFSSVRKYAGRVVLQEDGGYQLVVRGAAEQILSRCNWILDCDGNVTSLARENMESILHNVIRPMSLTGLTTICLAYKNYARSVSQLNEEYSSPEPNWDDEDSIVSNMTCVAIFGVEDPLREEVCKAAKKCKRMGITVHLMTGDNIVKAEWTAVKCGIANAYDRSVIFEGRTFDSKIRHSASSPIVSELFNKFWPKAQVVARATPGHKNSVIRGLSELSSRSLNRVTACVGKDLSDVQTLKMADVGFSMETVGSEVTKEASDIVVNDDGFAAVIKCIQWSRGIQDSIRKLLKFQLTLISVIFVTLTIGICVLGKSYLEPVHLLWVKAILDVLAPASFSSEPPAEEFLDPPYSRIDSLFSRSVAQDFIGHSLYQIVIIFILMFAGEYLFDFDDEDDEEGFSHKHRLSQHYTLIFNVFIIMTLFCEINSRILGGQRNPFHRIYNNYVFLGTWIGSFVIQVVIVQVGGAVMSTVALTLEHWCWCLLFGIGELLWGQLIISIPSVTRQGNSKHSKKQDIEKAEIAGKPVWELEYDDLINDSSLGWTLWMHGLTRLQNQLRVARAFKNILEDASELYGSEGSLNNYCSWPAFEDMTPGRSHHLHSVSVQNCSYPPVHYVPPENHNSKHLPYLKSKSADYVLFNPSNPEMAEDSLGPFTVRNNLEDKFFCN